MAKPTVPLDDATISFKCDRMWKNRVASEVKLKGRTMQDVCIEAISKYLKIEAPARAA